MTDLSGLLSEVADGGNLAELTLFRTRDDRWQLSARRMGSDGYNVKTGANIVQLFTDMMHYAKTGVDRSTPDPEPERSIFD